MPLFMDLHLGGNHTPEEVKELHLESVRNQDKFKAKFLKYWINLESGLSFCLVEAPDREACIAAHQAVDEPSTPCNVIEISEEQMNRFLGDSVINEYDMVINPNGEPDRGNRTIMYADIIAKTDVTHNHIKYLNDYLNTYNGKLVDDSNDGYIIIFRDSRPAFEMAIKLIDEFSETDVTSRLPGIPVPEIRIGIASGDPITATNKSIFDNTIQKAKKISKCSANNQVIFGSEFYNSLMINNEIANLHQKSPGFLSKADENLLIRWIDEIENPDNEVLTLSRLCERIGISKTQVYRKIKALTGMAPNEFIMDIRLRRAFKLLKRKELNISEIAATLGFLNPSYFSKCFNKRFGVLPSSLIR